MRLLNITQCAIGVLEWHRYVSDTNVFDIINPVLYLTCNAVESWRGRKKHMLYRARASAKTQLMVRSSVVAYTRTDSASYYCAAR